MDGIEFMAGMGLGLSIGLGVALRIMAARDPAPRIMGSPRPPRGPDANAVAVIPTRQREEMTR